MTKYIKFRVVSKVSVRFDDHDTEQSAYDLCNAALDKAADYMAANTNVHLAYELDEDCEIEDDEEV
jgi:hypothetical protein